MTSIPFASEKSLVMEGYLYTVEAFEDYLRRLNPAGVIAITRWRQSPPRELLKLCTVALEALRRGGADRPRDHIVVLALGGLGGVIVKKTPFAAAELAALERVAEETRLEVLFTPRGPAESPYLELLFAPNPDEFVAEHQYDIRPATDDSPFFFQFRRWRDARLFGTGWRDNLLLLSGRLVLLPVLAEALVLSCVLLAAPILRPRSLGAERGAATATLVYFSLIGLFI